MRPGPNGAGLSPKGIMAEIDASLRRLGTDYVDLYQIHRWDYAKPIEETREALHDIVKAGKARYIGASSMHAQQFARALGIAERHGRTRFVAAGYELPGLRSRRDRQNRLSPRRFSRRTAGFIERKGALYSLSLSVRPVDASRKREMTRITPYVLVALALSLSACTNPYDPVQRGLGGGILGAASGAAIGAAAGGRAGGGPRGADGGGNGVIGGG